MRIFKKIFIGSQHDAAQKVEGSYVQQLSYLRQVWNDDSYGLERLMRLFLCLAQFIFPILLIREIFGRFGATYRKLAVELYNLFKLLFPILVLWQGYYRSPIVIGIIIYLLLETMLHILHLIFLTDVHSASVSYHRSILLIFVHYVEVVLDFAVIYIGLDLLSETLTPLSAVYFSLVANTTVGFGDIHARGPAGQIAVIFQLLVCVMFIILFINYFSSSINDDEEEE